MTFRVGQKVECVDDNFGQLSKDWDQLYVKNLPKVGDICIVSYVGPFPGYTPAWIFIRLEGFSGGFIPSNFRPIVERKTDISVFTAMLNANKQDNGLDLPWDALEQGLVPQAGHNRDPNGNT
jgi:hypothetical protein